MLNHYRYLIVLAVLFCLSLPQTYADESLYIPSRHALVIGNDAYKFAPLENPKHDAKLIKQTLLKLNFAVVAKNNLSREQFYQTVKEFTEHLPEGSIAFVYYAGHGIQLQGNNYLVPVNMQLTSEQSVSLRSYPLNSLLERMNSAPSAVNVIILDACRNNPFRSQSNSQFRNLSNMGLVHTVSPKGTLIAYSTSPGQLAADGIGRSNSLYTETLAQQMLSPELVIEDILKNVADSIRKKTLDDQQPWYESSLVNSFYLIPPNNVKTLTQKSNQSETYLPYTSSRQIPPWYLSLKEAQWRELEWQLHNRARHLTKDELPLLEYRSTNDGNVIAMTTLALAYRNGFKQAVNEDGTIFRSGASNNKSISWLLKAANNGFPIAQRELGEMYIHGTGVDFDAGTALHWLEQAAQFNYPLAKLNFAQRRYETTPTKESMNTLWKAMSHSAAQIQQERLNKIKELSN
mgnify:CR=1 FL=1